MPDHIMKMNNTQNLRLSLKSSMRIISLIRCSGLRFNTLNTSKQAHAHMQYSLSPHCRKTVSESILKPAIHQQTTLTQQ